MYAIVKYYCKHVALLFRVFFWLGFVFISCSPASCNFGALVSHVVFAIIICCCCRRCWRSPIKMFRSLICSLSHSLPISLFHLAFKTCVGDEVKERGKRMAARFSCLYDAPNKAHHCQPRIFPLEIFSHTATYSMGLKTNNDRAFQIT